MGVKEHLKLESKFEREFVRWVRTRGGLAIKLPAIWYAGIPDRMVLHEGVVYFVELKRVGRAPEPLQNYWIDRLRRLGFNATWVNYYEFLRDLKGESVTKLKDYKNGDNKI